MLASRCKLTVEKTKKSKRGRTDSETKPNAKKLKGMNELFNPEELNLPLCPEKTEEVSLENCSMWEWKDDGNVWKSFDPLSQQILDLGGFFNQLPLTCNNTNYIIDLARMVQINSKTGKERPVRKRTRKEIGEAKMSHIKVCWEWSYDDVCSKWSPYAAEAVTHIEKAFLEYIKALQLNFGGSEGIRSYLIDLKNLSQTNVKTGTKRFIRRIEYVEASFDIPFPLTLSVDLQRIVLTTESEEFQAILKHIQSFGFAHERIQMIERVENCLLFEMYNLHKKLIVQRMAGSQPEEKFLFHGTKSSSIDSIIRNGFDLRFNVRSMFGKGTYFAVSPSMAHHYTSPDQNGNRHILICKVITGQSLVNKETNNGTLPQLSAASIYDTLKDKEIPTLFVAMERSQAYPAYILTYKETQKE